MRIDGSLGNSGSSSETAARHLRTSARIRITISRQELHYFDYELGMVEYTFKITLANVVDDPQTFACAANFWRELKEELSSCVAQRNLKLLKPSIWNAIHDSLGNALVASYRAISKRRKERIFLHKNVFRRSLRQDNQLLHIDRLFHLSSEGWLFPNEDDKIANDEKKRNHRPCAKELWNYLLFG